MLKTKKILSKNVLKTKKILSKNVLKTKKILSKNVLKTKKILSTPSTRQWLQEFRNDITLFRGLDIHLLSRLDVPTAHLCLSTFTLSWR